ncbi:MULTISPECIES: DNA-binding protein [Sphingomonadaceae]|nr:MULTISPECIES: DNA-binding protein [Sphingomonadaceae]MCH4892346.1 XRE family transcriptional regulator [Sphingomonas sp. SFZ2018-12]RQW40027.1 XRE family transcriptional regulator [Novosphingobium sp. LASN5T]
MSYDDFISELGKAGLSVRDFAALLGMRANSVSNYSKRGEVSSHLGIIAALLAELRLNGIPYNPVFNRVDVNKKKSRGSATKGKFGGDPQTQMELS